MFPPTPYRHSLYPPAPPPFQSIPPPSFRRRPESRTPVFPGVAVGRGVDSRFRGNDGMGGNDGEGGNDGMGGNDGEGVLNDGEVGVRDLQGGRRGWWNESVSPSPNPLPLGEGLRLAALWGGAVHMALAALYRRGARPCAPTPHHETRPLLRNPPQVITAKTNPPPNERPSPSGRGLGEGESLYATQRHITPPNPIIIPAPSRHSRESGNPLPGLSAVRDRPGFWIPACAGMTVMGRRIE